jgi:hypothetical protein
MATRLKEVDAVMVGMGWTGSILARELTKAGLTVIGLERGEDLSPRENFALPAIRDELRYSYRLELIQDPALETVTFRHRPSESALPMRRFGSFLPGNSVGGRERELIAIFRLGFAERPIAVHFGAAAPGAGELPINESDDSAIRTRWCEFVGRNHGVGRAREERDFGLGQRGSLAGPAAGCWACAPAAGATPAATAVPAPRRKSRRAIGLLSSSLLFSPMATSPACRV